MMGDTVVEQWTRNILSDTNYVKIWMSWTNGTISVGRGTVINEDVIMKYTDLNPSPVNYIALSGWDSPGTVDINYGKLTVILFKENLIIINLTRKLTQT